MLNAANISESVIGNSLIAYKVQCLIFGKSTEL